MPGFYAIFNIFSELPEARESSFVQPFGGQKGDDCDPGRAWFI